METMTGDSDALCWSWGVQSLPWLILTDTTRVVRAEGFGVNELNEIIGEMKNV